MTILITMSILLGAAAAGVVADAFQVHPHLHHHPAYIKHAYGGGGNIQEEEKQLHRTIVVANEQHRQHHHHHDHHFVEEVTTEENTPRHHHHQQQQQQQLSMSISTPVSYDEETGMVQTAVRAIVDHPFVVNNMIKDNAVVGLSSSFVITVGALHEIIDCLEIEWAHLSHHVAAAAASASAASSGGNGLPTEGLVILSLGHFLHYGRETLKQLVEISSSSSSSTVKQQQQQQEIGLGEQFVVDCYDPEISMISSSPTSSSTASSSGGGTPPAHAVVSSSISSSVAAAAPTASAPTTTSDAAVSDVVATTTTITHRRRRSSSSRSSSRNMSVVPKLLLSKLRP